MVHITAYIAAIVVGLSVVLAAALALEVRDPEPGGSFVLVVLGAAAVVAAVLGRVTYRIVADLLGDAPNPRG
jgi:uncharacterized membrane protein YccC